jgi:hypothetical protein
MTPVTAVSAPPIRRNTYQILKLSRTVNLALGALLLFAVIIGAQVHRDAMQTIGKDAEPSIIHAQHIKASLADMDADLANILLAPPNTANMATAGLIQRRLEEEQALFDAGGNVTFDAERKPLETLLVTGSLYHRLAQQTEDFHDAGNPEETSSYHSLASIMDDTLLPAATDLDQANDVELQHTYKRQAIDSALSTAFVIFAGVLALAGLVAMQLFLNHRTRRTFNPPLLLATVVTFALLIYALGAMLNEQKQLKIAKEDSFESIHALWQARAIAYESKAEESRFLLAAASDKDNAGQHDQAFFRHVRELASVPAGITVNDLLARANRGDHIPGFTGYLAAELNNVTFDGERQAAVKTLAAYENYLRIDAEMRRLEHAGQHQQAVALCVGNAQGQSNWAFDQFDHALGETLRINEEQFKQSVDAGLSSVGSLDRRVSRMGLFSTLEFKAVLLAALIAVFVVLGYAPRIKEYD